MHRVDKPASVAMELAENANQRLNHWLRIGFQSLWVLWLTVTTAPSKWSTKGGFRQIRGWEDCQTWVILRVYLSLGNGINSLNKNRPKDVLYIFKVSTFSIFLVGASKICIHICIYIYIYTHLYICLFIYIYIYHVSSYRLRTPHPGLWQLSTLPDPAGTGGNHWKYHPQKWW